MIKTYKITPSLRWRLPDTNEYVALTESIFDKGMPILQQAWQCIEDGTIEWRDVELVKNEL